MKLEKPRSRSDDAKLTTEAHRTCDICKSKLVTSARICGVERASSKGYGATGSP